MGPHKYYNTSNINFLLLMNMFCATLNSLPDILSFSFIVNRMFNNIRRELLKEIGT